MASELPNVTAALVALTEAGIPTDVQELLVRGDASRGIAPGAIIKALNTRPTPAATDTGLVTVDGIVISKKFYDHLVALSGYYIARPSTPDHEFVNVCNGDLRMLNDFMDKIEHVVTVTRSQAEELLAAERAEHDNTIATLMNLITDNAALIHDLNRIKDHETELVNDNAAKDADIDRVLADNRKCLVRIAELDAKLAAAEKALEFYANQENWKNGRFEQVDGGTVLRHYPASAHKDRGATARAVLGGKLS